MAKLTRLHAGLVLLALPIGCNALFDIERGTPTPATGNGGTAGGGTAGGGGPSSNGGSGGSGGSSAGDGGTNASNGNGGSSASSGSGGSTGPGGSSTNVGGSTMTGSPASSSNGGAASNTNSTGGSGGTSTIEPVSCDCSSTTPDDDLLIDDFEDGDSDVLPRDGRQGAFFGFLKEEDARPDVQLVCQSGQSNNCVALCFEGVLDGGGYPFAGLGLTLVQTSDGAAPYDASAFAGISFELKGSLPENADLRVEFATAETQPPEYGGTCSAGDACLDHYKVVVPDPTSDDTFALREAFFVNAGQGNGGGGWALPYAGRIEAPWAPAELLNINWMLGATVESLNDAPFNFCIDNIRFIEPEPTELIASWDFETDILDVDNVSANVTVSQASERSKEGAYSLRADIETGGWGCGRVEGSIAECWLFDEDECAASSDCTPVNRAEFALTDNTNPIDIQPGDLLSFWFYLPEGDLEWLNVFIAATDDYEWTVLPLRFPAKRNGWYYAEFVVPEGVEEPVHQWGLEVAGAPTFTGSIYVDEMSIRRPE